MHCRAQVPTLIVYGERDTGAPVDTLKQMPNSEVSMMKRAGHACYMDNPDEWHRLLSNFLRSPKVFGDWVGGVCRLRSAATGTVDFKNEFLKINFAFSVRLDVYHERSWWCWFHVSVVSCIGFIAKCSFSCFHVPACNVISLFCGHQCFVSLWERKGSIIMLCSNVMRTISLRDGSLTYVYLKLGLEEKICYVQAGCRFPV